MGSNITARNNVISDINEDITGNKFAGATGIFGLAINGGTGHRIYHNSVNMSGTVLGDTSKSVISSAVGIYTTNVTGVDVRNNIFANTMTGGAGSVAHVCAAFPASATVAMNLTWNNNAYYSGPLATQGIAQVATTFGTGFYLASDFNPGSTSPSTNFRAYISTLSMAGTNDDASFATTAAAPFTSATDLHIPNGTATPLESGGAAVGVATDIDGDARSATTPDIGADEFAGILVDILPPTISYPALPNMMTAATRSFTGVTIIDFSGVDAAPGTRPRVYYKRSTDANAFNTNDSSTDGWKYVEANGATSPFDFTIDHLKLSGGGGVSPGQAVQYFVVAQDLAGTPNVGINSGVFAALPGSVDLTASAFPITGTIRVYYVSAGIAGGRTLCSSGCDYDSLTNPGGVFDWINQNVLSGDIRIEIDGDSTAETGAIALNQWPEDGAGGYTVTLKPRGATRVVAGSGTTSLIKLNGADRVIIDGSLAALTGTDRSLTIRVTGTTQTVIWIGSASTSDGATNNTIRNCVISGNDSTGSTVAGIIAGSGSTLGNEAEAPNSYNTIQNNWIIKAQNGLYLRGNSQSLDQDWLVTGNTIGSKTSAEKMSYRGIFIGNARNGTISSNTINGAITASTSTTSGIQVGFVIDGGNISGNTISDIKNTNTAGYGCNGMYLGATTTASNLTIANNVIYDIAAYGYNGTGFADNGYGMFIATGGGYRLYHNSVRMTTDQTAASGIPAAINISSAITTPGSVDLRDNIFANTQTIGTRYAIYCGAGSTVLSDINYNDYYPGTGTLGYLGGVQGTISSWRTATGKDLQSISGDPLFASTTYLAPLLGSPVLAAGQPVGIATDITGAPRSLTNPTIGAYENAFAADMTVTMTGAPDPVAAGANETYTITVTNAGPGNAVNPVLVDAIPTNTGFVSISAPAGWACTAPAVGGTGIAQCTTASLAPGAPAVFTLVVRVDFCLGSLLAPITSIANTATVGNDAPDPNPVDNTASQTTTVADPGACNDNNDCTADTCDRTLGCLFLVYQAGHACGDQNGAACDLPDTCDGAGTCLPNYVPATTPCDDGLACTLDDQCSEAGSCSGTARDCNDSNVCTADACVEPSGTCENTVSGACNIVGVIDYYRDSPTLAEPSSKPVPGESVLRLSSLEPSETSVTDAGGQYRFLGEAGDITLTPQPLLLTDETECRSAITAADAAVMARVAVQMVQPTPNQRIAGDVTGNGSVTAYDAALTAVKASSASCVGSVFPIRTTTGSDWAFEPTSRNFTPLQGGEDYSFLGVLYGDITGNWDSSLTMASVPDPVDSSVPQFQSVPAALATSSGPGTGAQARLYLASGPAPTADGHWTAVLGLEAADGIMGLDLGLQYDPAVARVRSVTAAGLAAGFGLISNDTGSALLVSLYGVSPMQGTGEFLVVTYDLAVPVTGLPFLVPATANEGQIPLTPGPGIPRGASHSPDVESDLP